MVTAVSAQSAQSNQSASSAAGILTVLRHTLTLAWRADRRTLLIMLGTRALIGLSMLALLLFALSAIRTLLPSSDGGTHGAGAGVDASGLLIPAFAMALVGTLVAVLGFRSMIRGLRLNSALNRQAQREVLRVAAVTPLRRFEDPEFHNRLARLNLGVQQHPHNMLMALTEGVAAVFSLIAVSVMVAFTSWWVLPVVLLAAAPTLNAGRRTNMSMFARNVAQTEETRTVRYFSSLLTGRDHAKEVRALGIGRPVLRRWREARTAKEAADVAGQTKETRTRIKGKLGSDGITLALLLALIGLTAGDRIDLATAAVAFLATRMLTAQVAGVTGALLRAGRALPFLQEFREFTADPAEPGDEPAVRPFTSLRAENVSYTYPGAERPAVDGVSLELKAGQIVALVGFNGSGKTTLTKVLAGLYEPTEGNLVRDGAVVTDDDLASLRSSTAVVFQDFARFKLSARENITLGRGGREPQDGEAERMAALAGIDTQLAGLPQGFDTVLSTEFSNGTDLSGGQWQKVAIARAFYRDAPFVILDEPTAALDPRAEAELFDRIRELFAGRTVLLISHRFSSVRNADRIHVMDQGRVVEQGTHRELLGLDGTYAELFTTQAAAYLDDDQPAS